MHLELPDTVALFPDTHTHTHTSISDSVFTRLCYWIRIITLQCVNFSHSLLPCTACDETE